MRRAAARTPGGRPRRPPRRAAPGRRRAGATARSRSSAQHGVVPVRRPHAVAVARPGRPGQHPVGELDAEPVAQPAQVRLGVAQEVAGVDDRGVVPAQQRRAAAPAGAARCRRARRSRASGRRTRPPRPGRGSAARCGSAPTQARSSSGSEVVGHVLDVVDGDAVRQRREQAGDHLGRRRSAARRSPRRGRGGRARSGRGRPRRTARRRRPCPAGSPRPASSPWRCCAGPTTSRPARRHGADPSRHVGGDAARRTAPAAARRPGRARRCRWCGRRPTRTGTTPAKVPVTNASAAL